MTMRPVSRGVDEVAPESTTFSASEISSISATYSKILWRIVPFLFICYVSAYLDRINVGFAQLQMKQTLGFSDAVYGMGAGIFFAGYVLFEVPSNMLLERVGARKTLTRIMILWGVTSAGMMFVTSPRVYYAMRFMLGAFEAGFFPGMILFLTYWFPAERRGNVMALFLTAVAMAGVLGGPLSGWLIGRLNDVNGLEGWRWMFLLEGLPACVLGVVAFFYLDDRPEQARWLTPSQKAIVARQLRPDGSGSALAAHHRFADAIRSPRIYLLALAWFTFICGVYVISFWLPLLIRDKGISNPVSIGLLTAIPYAIAAVVMIATSRHSDRSRERRWHIVGCAIVGAAGLIAVAQPNVGLALAISLLSVTTAAIFTLQPLFWALATDYLQGAKAAAGTIAFINSLGLIGGFVSPTILGWVRTTTGSLANGLYLMSSFLIVGAVLTLTFRRSTSGE